MSDRLSAEERAIRRCPGSEEHHFHIEEKCCPECGGIRDEILEAENAAAEAARERLQDEIQAYQSDPKYDNRYLQGQDAMREPITDKSICQRGHPVACIDTTGNDQSTDFCSACTQLEAELKPLRDGLELLLQDDYTKHMRRSDVREAQEALRQSAQAGRSRE